MSIWGSKRVSSLQYTPLHVLPSFKISLQSKNFNVGYEISLSIQRVVRKFGAEQDYITWDVIMDMVEILLGMVEVREIYCFTLYSVNGFFGWSLLLFFFCRSILLNILLFGNRQTFSKYMSKIFKATELILHADDL